MDSKRLNGAVKRVLLGEEPIGQNMCWGFRKAMNYGSGTTDKQLMIGILDKYDWVDVRRTGKYEMWDNPEAGTIEILTNYRDPKTGKVVEFSWTHKAKDGAVLQWGVPKELETHLKSLKRR